MNLTPLLSPDHLHQMLEQKTENLLIIDVSEAAPYLERHIPGAVNLAFSTLLSNVPPTPGKLPDLAQLQSVLGEAGIDNSVTVIAYDDQGGGRASRLYWTLDYCGHPQHAVLNGGIQAWAANNYPLQAGQVTAPQRQFQLTPNDSVIADMQFILDSLDNAASDVKILDARSPEEYAGLKSPSQRHGHIPGAVNLNWLETMQGNGDPSFKSEQELKTMLAERQLSPNDEIIVHCQTHHRSSHSYVMLKQLGYERVRGYPGSWSEWGNDPNTPIEQ